MTRTQIRVDLTKDWLDVFHPIDRPSRIGNTRQAIRGWLQRLGAADLPVFEGEAENGSGRWTDSPPNGGCDGLLLREAAMLRHAVHRADPLQGWRVAQSLKLPRTDRADARVVSRMGRERRLEPSPAFVAKRGELTEPNGRRDPLKRMETQEKKRLTRTFPKTVKADIATVLRLLARRIARIDGQIAAFLKARTDSARAVRLLETISGVGRVASVTLLSAMPELGVCDRRTVASLGGLAPNARESGRWRGRRTIGAGRRRVRRALYMAAFFVLRHPGLFRGAVDGMRAAGKPGAPSSSPLHGKSSLSPTPSSKTTQPLRILRRQAESHSRQGAAFRAHLALGGRVPCGCAAWSIVISNADARAAGDRCEAASRSKGRPVPAPGKGDTIRSEDP
jgi:transposase